MSGGGALVVCTVVGCIFSTVSFRGKNRPWSWLRFKGPPQFLGKVSATLTIRVPVIHVTSTILLVL